MKPLYMIFMKQKQKHQQKKNERYEKHIMTMMMKKKSQT